MVSRSAEDACVGFWKSINGKLRHCHTVPIRHSPARASLACRHRLTSAALVRATPFEAARQDANQASSRAYSTRRHSSNASQRSKSPQRTQAPRRIAVLGGGLTGLTTAHYLARHAKNAHITIYEASDRLGGWIDPQSLTVDVNNKEESVLVQRGARMVRSWASSNKCDELVLYDVIANLRLGKHTKTFRPEGPSNSRYVYYPDHLVRMPSNELTVENILGSIVNFLTEPVWRGALSSFFRWNDVNKPRPSAQDVDETLGPDESLGDFMRRRLVHDDIVKNLLSGVLHGVHGGDVNKLSARHTMFESMWHNDKFPLPKDLYHVRGRDLVLVVDFMSNPNWNEILDFAKGAVDQWTLLAFEDGLHSLVKSLEQDLREQPNVEIRLNSPVESLSHAKNVVVVRHGSQTPEVKTEDRYFAYDQVISTLFSKDVARLARPENSLPALAETHAVTIMTVNLWYPNPSLLEKNPGFGYLVPQGTPNNDECVLGVLFDSELPTGPEVPGTKLTVMLGGHYWDGWDVLPTEEMAIAMAREAVSRHLAIDLNEPFKASAKLCRDCMPQHYVGHWDRMARAHKQLLDTFHGQLMVAGPSYTDIGVIPAMRAGYDAAMRVATGLPPPYFQERTSFNDVWRTNTTGPLPELEGFFREYDHVGSTGLASFVMNGTRADLVQSATPLPVKKRALRAQAQAQAQGMEKR